MIQKVIFAFVATLYVAFASPVADTRVVNPMVSYNLTRNTCDYMMEQLGAIVNKMVQAYIALGDASSDPVIKSQLTWIANNHGVTNLEYEKNIKDALTKINGDSYDDLNGKTYVSNSMTTIIDALKQANLYLSGVDSAGASSIASRIQAISDFKAQIDAMMSSCANLFQTMEMSCDDSLYTLIAQFLYQTSTLMKETISGWAVACPNDIDSCSVLITPTVSFSLNFTRKIFKRNFLKLSRQLLKGHKRHRNQ